MESTRKSKPTLNGKQQHHLDQAKANFEQAKIHAQEAGIAVGDAMGELWGEGKLYANEWYKDGMKHFNATEKELEQYADQMAASIKKSPLKSVMIAGGIGFLIAALLKK